VAAVASNPDTKLIVRSAVDLLRGLGIRSVAEGVESPQVAAVLQAMGCDAAQGWQFSRPLNAAAATRWLAHRRTVPAAGPAAGVGAGPAAGLAVAPAVRLAIGPAAGPAARPGTGAVGAGVPAPAGAAAPGPLAGRLPEETRSPSPVPGDGCVDAAARP
jgi:hypothetical protein